MRARGALQAVVLLASALWATPSSAKKEHPDFKVNAFEHQPGNLQYFKDSDVILFQDIPDNTVYRSDDAGVKWKAVEGVPEDEAWLLYLHAYDPTRAYILTQGTKHYRTSDRGKTWKSFQAGAEIGFSTGEILQFHAADPDRIIFNGMRCSGLDCQDVATYTTDGFETDGKILRTGISSCSWAKSSDLFTTGDKDLDKNRVLCVIADSLSTHRKDQRLVISDNFFQKGDKSADVQEFEPNLDMDKPVKGVVNIATVKKYLLVATTSANTDEMALFVSDDTLKWHRAIFPTAHDDHDHRVRENAYTVLESTNYSIQIDVMTTRPSNPMGVMLTSNSNGTFFTENIEHTNRNHMGNVDFERISNIQGIFLVNKVDNWKDVESKPDTKKKVVTEITFDDGRTFESVTADGKKIHLHSVTELSNVGKVYSSPAPGLLMAIGNTGDHLGDYWEDGNLYVSDDAGKTWTKGLDGPHKYEFGDQGSILVAVKDSKKMDVDEISYSLDHGVTWVQESLPKDVEIEPYILTTTQDATSLKFLLIGKSKDSKFWQVITIDFEGLHEDTCKKDDLEEWHARVDKDGKPTCLMGHTQSFTRRKKNAECFLKQEFKHAVTETADCDCTDLDYECDYNFIRSDDDKCVSKGPIAAPDGACSKGDPDATFKGTSGYRKIPGNTCKPTKEMDEKYKDVERKCGDVVGPPSAPATGLITQTGKQFGRWDSWDKHYLERGESSSSDDETIIMRPRSASKFGPIWVTHDHGKKWDEVKALEDEKILQIVPHLYFKDMVFFITSGKDVKYTVDRGHHFHTFKAPTDPDPQAFPLAFHPDKKDWLIWIGKKCEDDECYRVASYSKDRGDHWETGARYVSHCEFTGSSSYKLKERKEEQILCLKHEREDNGKDNPMILVSTNDWFVNEKTHEKNVREFATMSEFIVAAVEDTDKKSLQAVASLDGSTFAQVKFPYNLDVPHQHGYTVLDSSTHAVNLFVATDVDVGCRYGSIIKSNSNGTLYALSVSNVNCNEDYYVDFEKMLGLEGVALVNVVANPDAKGSAPKKLQTKISHNDGAEWAFLPTPSNHDDMGKFHCLSQGNADCALHIHGYTERGDHRKTYSSEGAVGFMFGWGNVGDSLGSLADADTFMTADGASRGSGSRRDGGRGRLAILDLEGARVCQGEDGGVGCDDDEVGGSRDFLIWGKDGDEVFTTNLDFSRFSERVCKFDADDARKSDYEVWSPSHPKQANGCLFGHKSQYLRKKEDRKCYNDGKLGQLYGKEDCTCLRQDFECDYNYEPDNHGQCSLVKGLSPLDAADWCKNNPDAIEYFEPTGYRRIPLTTCVGGRAMDTESQPHPCPGREEDFGRKHAASGIAIFFAVTIPIALAAAAGWYVWRNWTGKFGQIHLGEPSGVSALDSEQPWVRYPVIALSAIVAVALATPLIVTGLWRTVKGAADRWGVFGGGSGRGAWTRLGGGGGSGRRFTTRDSFARGGTSMILWMRTRGVVGGG
ncbi:hypothetical protein B0T17DRAFT_511348 [Bombardia bombarda]|uniref:Vacuolar protein sorting/targeting protein 10 n=1 Tax=Bombardia bombarda TaxID=252184 RepID=A0AA39T2K7_9PEZI|nr:hypothetical protein B0T17DRAFT_511348 [Bombardia bombarda]